MIPRIGPEVNLTGKLLNKKIEKGHRDMTPETVSFQSDKYHCYPGRNHSTQNHLQGHFNLPIQQVKPVLSKLMIGDQFAYNRCYNVRLRFKI